MKYSRAFLSLVILIYDFSMDSSKYPITCLICTVFKIPKKGKKLKFFQYLDKNQNSRFPLNLIKLVTSNQEEELPNIFPHTRLTKNRSLSSFKRYQRREFLYKGIHIECPPN